MKSDKYEEKHNQPKQFLDFVQKPEFYNFLQAMLEYCKELFRLESKQQVLEQEAKQRGLPVP